MDVLLSGAEPSQLAQIAIICWLETVLPPLHLIIVEATVLSRGSWEYPEAGSCVDRGDRVVGTAIAACCGAGKDLQ